MNRLPLASVPFATSSGFTAKKMYVVKDTYRWQEVWSALQATRRPQPPLPKIDFSTSMVIVVAAGRRTSGGYSVEILGGRIVDGQFMIASKFTEPGRACIVTTGISSPVDIAVFPRFDDAIELDEVTITYSCP